MTPVERAKALRGDTFVEELEAHLLLGYVFSTPELFLMGRPVPAGADISDVWRVWPAEECNAWFVFLAVGDARKILALMPRPLPWVGWVRQGRRWAQTHWIPTDALRARLVSSRAAAPSL